MGGTPLLGLEESIRLQEEHRGKGEKQKSDGWINKQRGEELSFVSSHSGLAHLGADWNQELQVLVSRSAQHMAWMKISLDADLQDSLREWMLCFRGLHTDTV